MPIKRKSLKEITEENKKLNPLAVLPQPGAPSAAGRMGIELGHRENGHIDIGPFFRPRQNQAYNPEAPADANNAPFQHPTGLGGFFRRLLGDNADELNAQYSAQDRELELERKRAQIKAGETKDVLAAEGDQKADLMNKANMFELLRMDKEHGNKLATIFAENDYDWKKIQHNEEFQRAVLERTHELAKEGITFKFDAEAKNKMREMYDRAAAEINSDDPVKVREKISQNLKDISEGEKLNRDKTAATTGVLNAEAEGQKRRNKEYVAMSQGLNYDPMTGQAINVHMDPNNPMQQTATPAPNVKPVARIPLETPEPTTAPAPVPAPVTQPTPTSMPLPQPVIRTPSSIPVYNLPPTATSATAPPPQHPDQGPLAGIFPQQPDIQKLIGGGEGNSLIKMLQANPQAHKHAQKMISELILPTPQTP